MESKFDSSKNYFRYSDAGVYLIELFTFMNHYKWISNSYVAEFFTQGLWQKLPLSWQICLNELTLQEVADNILTKSEKTEYRFVWPLSLLSFVATCHSLSLNRECKNNDDSTQQLTGIFKKHIKPKKRHELAVLPKVIDKVCEDTKSKHVVEEGMFQDVDIKVQDVGSGLGHLSRMLAYRYGLDVTAVEMNGPRLPVAEKFDLEIVEELKRQNEKTGIVVSSGEVNHIAKMISPNITTDEFIHLINTPNKTTHPTSSDNKNDEKQPILTCESNKSYVLVGLHTCGDLASTMLKVFSNTSVIKGLVSVSCCYFRLTLHEKKSDDNETNEFTSDFIKGLLEERNLLKDGSCSSGRFISADERPLYESSVPHNSTCGFPLSKFIQQLPFQPLKYKSFETACHFVDDYAQKLKDESPNLKLHCYRAVMEVFIRRVDPALVLAPIRCKKIKNAAAMSFEEYACKVFERLEKEFDPTLLQDINYTELLSQWKNVAIFHSLTLLLGPVIESIALMDKWMYLNENGKKWDVLQEKRTSQDVDVKNQD